MAGLSFLGKEERLPRALRGSLLINTVEELNNTIRDHRLGRLRQLIDTDPKLVSLMTALELWKVLCNENLARDDATSQCAFG